MLGASHEEEGNYHAFADPLATPTPNRSLESALPSLPKLHLTSSYSGPLRPLSQTRSFNQLGDASQSPKKLPESTGESLRFKLRRAKIEEMERQQAIEDLANIRMSQVRAFSVSWIPVVGANETLRTLCITRTTLKLSSAHFRRSKPSSQTSMD